MFHFVGFSNMIAFLTYLRDKYLENGYAFKGQDYKSKENLYCCSVYVESIIDLDMILENMLEDKKDLNGFVLCSPDILKNLINLTVYNYDNLIRLRNLKKHLIKLDNLSIVLKMLETNIYNHYSSKIEAYTVSCGDDYSKDILSDTISQDICGNNQFKKCKECSKYYLSTELFDDDNVCPSCVLKEEFDDKLKAKKDIKTKENTKK